MIEDVEFGHATCLAGKALILDRKSLTNFLIRRDDRIRNQEVSLAKPDESIRINCIKDVHRARVQDSRRNKGSGLVGSR